MPTEIRETTNLPLVLTVALVGAMGVSVALVVDSAIRVLGAWTGRPLDALPRCVLAGGLGLATAFWRDMAGRVGVLRRDKLKLPFVVLVLAAVGESVIPALIESGSIGMATALSGLQVYAILLTTGCVMTGRWSDGRVPR